RERYSFPITTRIYLPDLSRSGRFIDRSSKVGRCIGSYDSRMASTPAILCGLTWYILRESLESGMSGDRSPLRPASPRRRTAPHRRLRFYANLPLQIWANRNTMDLSEMTAM